MDRTRLLFYQTMSKRCIANKGKQSPNHTISSQFHDFILTSVYYTLGEKNYKQE